MSSSRGTLLSAGLMRRPFRSLALFMSWMPLAFTLRRRRPTEIFHYVLKEHLNNPRHVMSSVCASDSSHSLFSHVVISGRTDLLTALPKLYSVLMDVFYINNPATHKSSSYAKLSQSQTRRLLPAVLQEVYSLLLM